MTTCRDVDRFLLTLPISFFDSIWSMANQRSHPRFSSKLITSLRRGSTLRTAIRACRHKERPVEHVFSSLTKICRRPDLNDVGGPSEPRRPVVAASGSQIRKFSMNMHVFLRRGRPRAAGEHAKTHLCQSRRRPARVVGEFQSVTPRFFARNFGFMPLSWAARARESAARPATAMNRELRCSIYIDHVAAKRTQNRAATARVALRRTRARRVTSHAALARARARRVTNNATLATSPWSIRTESESDSESEAEAEAEAETATISESATVSESVFTYRRPQETARWLPASRVAPGAMYLRQRQPG